MEGSVEGLLHSWGAAYPDLLNLVGLKLVELVADELLIPSARVLAFLGESCEEVEVVLACSVAVVGEGFTKLESDRVFTVGE